MYPKAVGLTKLTSSEVPLYFPYGAILKIGPKSGKIGQFFADDKSKFESDYKKSSLCYKQPWEEAAEKQKKVVYVAGAWSFLHPAHQHILKS